MITLRNKETNEPIGEITEEQLKFLVDELVEETPTDQDYYLNRDELISLEEDGADEALLTMLKGAMGDSADLEILWSRT